MLQKFTNINSQITDSNKSRCEVQHRRREIYEKVLIMKDILTEREQSVLFYVAQGFINSEIADKLHISVHTVKAHLEAIYEKFGVKNRVQAVMKAVVLGIIDLNIFI